MPVYDGNGTLVKKVAGGQTTVYVGPHYEKNVTTGQETKYYFFGADRHVKSNDNVTEEGSFRQLIMLPGMSPPFEGRSGSRYDRGGKVIRTILQAKAGHQG